MQATLKTLSLVFSSSLVLYSLIMFAIAGLADRSAQWALCLFLCSVLMTTQIFYWPLSELMLGESLMLVYFAALLRFLPHRPLALVLSLLFLPTLLFAHPLIVLPLSFTVIFLVQDGRLNKRQALTLAVLTLLILLIKYSLFRDPYDKGSLGGLRNFIRLFPDYFRLYANSHFLKKAFTDYAGWTVLLILCLVHYYKTKRWERLALVAGYSLASLGFIHVCFPDARTPDFYRENLYQVLPVYVVLPFVFDVLPGEKNKLRPVAIIGLITFFAWARIFTAHYPFTQRVAWLRTYLTQHPAEKRIDEETETTRRALQLTWATPYEFWLLSTLENDRSASLMIIDSLQHIPDYGGEGNVFVQRFAVDAYSVLPQPYFRFNDTLSAYHIYKHRESKQAIELNTFE